MINSKALIIETCMQSVRNTYKAQFGVLSVEVGNILSWATNLALENIANTDTLYHDLDHTIMVTQVGQQILIGKHLIDGQIEPLDWMHFIVALLFHDIGYVRGVCKGDANGKVSDGQGNLVDFDEKGTQAQLSRWHVDRAKEFVHERFDYLPNINNNLISEYIEMTRFPIPNNSVFHQQTETLHGLVRAADLIGQLGDPNYFIKIPGLYYEFVENEGVENVKYKSPGHMRKHYAKFYWSVARPYIEPALRYLRVTQEGKQWIANLHSHVFDSEHES